MKLCSRSLLSSDWLEKVKGELLPNGVEVELSKNITGRVRKELSFFMMFSYVWFDWLKFYNMNKSNTSLQTK